MYEIVVALLVLLIVLAILGFTFWKLNKKLSKPTPKVSKKKLLKKK